MNLNTESGVLIEDPGLAREVEASIERSMRPENSWEAARETGDHAVSWWTRLKTRLWSFLPIRSLV
jgi:phosphatidylserine/phosphatidylglycerophosphate/cardiolipin synthase-like enzyme